MANVWQQPLTQLAAKIKAKAVEVADIHRYQQWLHNESHLNLEQHQAMMPDLEREWTQNFREPKHDHAVGQPLLLQTQNHPLGRAGAVSQKR